MTGFVFYDSICTVGRLRPGKRTVSALKDALKEALLFDFYGNLLKEKQREIYEASVMEDMSLSEISEEYGISRQAVSAMLNRCRQSLSGYEEKLGLIKRFEETGKLAREIKGVAESIHKNTGNKDAGRIASLADRILGDL